MNELQALVTGMLIGSLLHQREVDVVVEPHYDDDNNYLPEFGVIGQTSGTRLLVSVTVVEEGEHA